MAGQCSSHFINLKKKNTLELCAFLLTPHFTFARSELKRHNRNECKSKRMNGNEF